MAHDGLAMAIRPAHTMYDGDVVFALSTGKAPPIPDVTPIGAAAARALSSAILKAVIKASGLGGVPSVSELEGTTSKRVPRILIAYRTYGVCRGAEASFARSLRVSLRYNSLSPLLSGRRPWPVSVERFMARRIV